MRHIFLSSCQHKTFFCAPEKYKFNLPQLGTVKGGLIREKLLISAPSSLPLLLPSLIFSSIKQPYSKADNSRMFRYGNAIFTSNLYQKSLKIKTGVITFALHSNFKQTFEWLFIFYKHLDIEERRLSIRLVYSQNEISFFLVHIMGQISVDTSCVVSQKVLILF